MKRKSFLLVLTGIFVAWFDSALGATKKPTPKPTITKKPITKATPTIRPSASPSASNSKKLEILNEYALVIDGKVIMRENLKAPTSFYASYVKDGIERPVLVAVPTSKTIKIFTARCPHQGNILNLEFKGEFTCDLHGARFNSDTGKVLDGPTIQNLEQYSLVENSEYLIIRA